MLHQLRYELVGHAYPEAPGGRPLDVEGLAPRSFPQERVPAAIEVLRDRDRARTLRLLRRDEGGDGDEGEDGLKELLRQEEVLVAELEEVVLGQGRDLLADVERVGAADEVLGELRHELGGPDRPVVGLDEAIGVDELDGAGIVVSCSGGRGRRGLGLELDAGDVVAHQLEAPVDHLEVQELIDAHLFLRYLADALSVHKMGPKHTAERGDDDDGGGAWLGSLTATKQWHKSFFPEFSLCTERERCWRRDEVGDGDDFIRGQRLNLERQKSECVTVA